MNRRWRKRVTLVAFIAFVAIGLAVFFIFSTSQSVSYPLLPNPNGYDDFLAAGNALTWNVDDPSALSENELRVLIATNAEPLRLLRLGLTRRCSVPTKAAITNFGKISTELINQRRLVQLMAAEGRLAQLEKRPGDAARNYVDAIQFGNEISHGGFVINRLVGITCESIGTFRLVKILPDLNCGQIRPLIASLERIESGRVTWKEVMANEKKFAGSQLDHYSNPINRIKAYLEAWRVDKRAEVMQDKAIARTRLLMLELALRCYRAEKGQAPSSLEQLTTEYLRHLPADPFTTQPVIYRCQGTHWLLYCLGPDKTDDGGKPLTRGTSSKGDFFLESL